MPPDRSRTTAGTWYRRAHGATAFYTENLPDYLIANGGAVFLVEPRFMPLSVKSRLPVRPFLIRAWLAVPFKPLGKQMLVCARPKR